MNYLTLNLTNADLVLSDNSAWKNLYTWLNGGTWHPDYYDASNCGDYWLASQHWISIDSESTYLTFTIEYEFIDATATDSCLCQIKFDGFEDGGVAVTADSSGLNISTDASKHINCDYSNANIKIDITANLLTKEITTYIHKDNEPLAKKVSVSNYSFTEFVIQAGSRGDIVYKLPTTTKLLNVSVSDVAVSYSNFPETIDYIDKLGLARIWANIKSYISSQLLGKSDTGHTHVSSDVTDLLSDAHTWTSQQSYNSDLNLNYASTDVDDIVNSVAGSATLDNFVHMTGNETVNGIKSFPDGVIANVTGSATSATNDGSGNVISTTYGKLGAANTWTNGNTYNGMVLLNSSSDVAEQFKQKLPKDVSVSSDPLVRFNTLIDSENHNVVVEALGHWASYVAKNTTLKYKNDSTKQGTIEFRLASDGTGLLYPQSPFECDLGNYGNQWRTVYAKDSYHTTSDVTIRNTYKNTVQQKGVVPSDNLQMIMGSWRDKNDAVLGYERFVQYASSGIQTFEVDISNTASNGSLDPNGTFISSGFQVVLDSTNGSKLNIYADTRPTSDNTYNLGDSTKRWKSFNGVNPGALSLPSENYSTANLDPTNWNTTGSANTYTPPSNGWLGVQVQSADILDLSGQYVFVGRTGGGGDFYPQSALSHIVGDWVSNKLIGCVIIPVISGKTYDIRVKIGKTQQEGSIIYARFYPCLGNV